ncbi:tripartite tricarboxylate transporter TctB family protein [Burkholderia dolosa]|uniref:tripartite tricarboxylate transporter TctB family protein n=1 Tax=Burkholderia dolosa TaxID=152500 RepID=UPI001B954CE9|nr:tripartite tricarboxylate transporter TctB family protein [Burkholderia dolosa]MBR8457095.1 tripartite tricarboxylate transporter TctB family protein [Burkholderia dolosa]MDN7419406.1 tripartite tricarboxylate transporter TctB family protein [Burkholderia dolosa]
MSILQKNVFSGLLFAAVGLSFGIGALRSYPIGTAASMGPGYFPLILSSALVVLGVIAAFQRTRTESNERTPGTTRLRAFRPVFFVLLANATFAVLLQGIPFLGIPAHGLVLSIIGAAYVASFAGRGAKHTTSMLLALTLAAACYLIFILGMGLPISAWPHYVIF